MAAEILVSGRIEWKRLKIASRASLGHARPFVLDADQHLVADRRRADLDDAARRREGDGVVDEIVDQPREPRFVAHAPIAAAHPRPGEGDLARPCRRAPSQSGSSALDQPAEIDRLEPRPRQLGVEPRGFGDVDDQPVEPAHVAGGRRRAAGARSRRILDPLERVDRGAQRGERVLELVGDVGGEGLGRVDPLAAGSGSCRPARGRAGRSRRAARAGPARRPRGRGRAGPGAPRAPAGAAGWRWSAPGSATAGSRRSGSRRGSAAASRAPSRTTWRTSRALTVSSSTPPSAPSIRRAAAI